MIGNKNVTSYNANLLDTRPAQVRSWLDGLPLDDVDRTARTILQALVSVKNRRIPVRQRFQLLEAVTSTLTLLLPELAKRYSAKPLPLAKEDRETVELSTALQLELIHGYEQVLNESSRLYFLSWRRVVSTVLHRLFRYRSNILCNYRLCYLPYPPGVWKQLYWYYSLAEDYRLLGNRVSVPGKRGGKTSLKAEFKRLMLLSLLSPNSFEAASMNEVYAHLDQWVKKVRLERYIGAATSSTFFVFNLHSDLPPQLGEQADLSRGVRQLRCLDTGELVRVLRERLVNIGPQYEKPQAKQRADAVSLATLQNLLAGWDRTHGRSEDRQRARAHLPVAVGIDAIYNLLSGDKVTPSLTVHADANNALDARLIDYSNNGFRLRLTTEKVHQIKLDDLVALRDPNDGHWGVGQVRWMQNQDDQQLHLGVMSLSQQVLPVMVRNDDSPAPPVPCLLGVNKLQPVLYLPRGHEFKKTDKLWLVHSERETQVILGESLAATHGFSAYYSHWSAERPPPGLESSRSPTSH
jgi:hypothetical protein